MDGQTLTLDTTNATIEQSCPTGAAACWRSSAIPHCLHPDACCGIYGHDLRVFHSGNAVPGVVGGICLLLALFALQVMPISYAGLALMILGIVPDVSRRSFPASARWGWVAVIAFVIGSVMLIGPPDLPAMASLGR